MSLLGVRRFAWITVVFAYVLMVWGNVVSSTGSGLACPDWPFCHGTLFPTLTPAIILEWGHRLLAATTGTLIVGLLVCAVHYLRRNGAANPLLTRAAVGMTILLGVQILLGGLTVMLKLSIVASTIHLLIAHTLLGALIGIALSFSDQQPATAGEKKVLALSGAVLTALLIQIAMGAVIRHSHVGLACPDFPACRDSAFLPEPISVPGLLVFMHRWWGVLVLAGCFQIAALAWKTSSRVLIPASAALAFCCMQVTLGILSVLTGLNTHVRATHAAVGYALWATLVYLTIQLALRHRVSRTTGRTSEVAA